MCVCTYTEEGYKLLLSIWNKLGLEGDKEQSATREVTHNFASAEHFKSSQPILEAPER